MADGILGLLGNVGNKVRGLLSSPTVQGLGAAAAFGFNPLLGLLAAPGIQNSRERKTLENDVLRQSLVDAKRRSSAAQDLTGLLGEQTTATVPSPIGLLNMEGGVDAIPATRMGQVPTVSTPGGQDRLLGLLAQLAPEQVAERFLSQPSAPEFKTDIGKLFGDLETAELTGNAQAAAAIRGAIESQLGGAENFDDVRAARNDVIKNSQPFLVAKQGFERVQVGATTASPAGDLALTFGLMKVLDPTSVVREGEQATVQNAGGIAERIRNAYNKLLTGERLTPEQRQDFLNQATLQFEKAVDQQNRIIDDFRGFAERQDFDVADVVPEFIIPNFEPGTFTFGGNESAIDPVAEAAESVVRGAGEAAGSAVSGLKVRVADIGRMSLDKLNALDPKRMSPEQLAAAARRYEELNGG